MPRQPLVAMRYRAEAKATRDQLQRERERLATVKREQQTDLRERSARSLRDDVRVLNSTAALRDAREHNHFTEKMRMMIEGTLSDE